MRWPWDRTEKRQQSGGAYSDAIVSLLQAQAGGASVGEPGALAALEIASGLWARGFASAELDPPIAAVTPSFLASVARQLVRRGESLWAIDVRRGESLWAIDVRRGESLWAIDVRRGESLWAIDVRRGESLWAIDVRRGESLWAIDVRRGESLWAIDVRRGESLWAIDVRRGEIVLTPAASWDVRAGRVLKPGFTAWTCRGRRGAKRGFILARRFLIFVLRRTRNGLGPGSHPGAMPARPPGWPRILN